MGNNGGIDRLTALPIALLLTILSLLPIKSAVSTSVLGRQWRNIWKSIVDVTADAIQFRDYIDFVSSVDRFLSQITSPKIRTLNVNFWNPNFHYGEEYVIGVDNWFRLVCDRNVEAIEVKVPFNYNQRLVMIPPRFIFHTKSMQKLVFINFYEYQFPVEVYNMPNLKTLYLAIPPSQCNLVSNFIKLCPVLEDVTLIGNGNWVEKVRIEICGLELKKLNLCFYNSPASTRFLIDSPKLDWVSIRAADGLACTQTNSSTVSCFSIYSVSSANLASSLLQLFANVKLLVLDLYSTSSLKGYSGSCCKIEMLDIGLDTGGHGWNWSNEDALSSSLFDHVKRIMFTTDGFSNDLVRFARYLLKCAPVVERFSCTVTYVPGAAQRTLTIRELGWLNGR